MFSMKEIAHQMSSELGIEVTVKPDHFILQGSGIRMRVYQKSMDLELGDPGNVRAEYNLPHNTWLNRTDNEIKAMGIGLTTWNGTLRPALVKLFGQIKEGAVLGAKPDHRFMPFSVQVCLILQRHNITQSKEEAEKTQISEDGFARIYVYDLVIVIQPEEEVMHISTLNPPSTRSYSFREWDIARAESFNVGQITFSFWWNSLKPALFEIIELLESPDTSSEMTLEDQLISVLEKHGKGYAKFRAAGTGLKINFNSSYVVLGDGGWDNVKIGNNQEMTFSRAGLKRQVENKINGKALGWWGNHSPVILDVIELLESSKPKPDHSPEAPEDETVIQLRKQVEELQGLVDLTIEGKDARLDNAFKRIEELKKKLAEYERPLEEQAKEWVEKREYLEAEIMESNQVIEEEQNRIQKLGREINVIQKQIDVFNYRIKKLNQKGVTSDS